MRLFLMILLTSVFVTALHAQTLLPESYADYTARQRFVQQHGSNISHSKKWWVDQYVSVSTGVVFYNGHSNTFISAPVGLQLNRRINNNLTAFAGVSVAPVFNIYSQNFMTTDVNKGMNNGFLKSNSPGMYTRAEMGLMYTNDDKTFSISGSIGVERSNYPAYPATRPMPVYTR
jgi:hypothetical protein